MRKNRRHTRENRVLKALIRAAAGAAAFIAALVLLLMLIWWRGQQAEPQTDEQVAEVVQQEQAEPLVIEIPEPAKKEP